MLDPALAFRLGTLFVIVGWLGLLVALVVPRVRHVVWPVTQFVFPAILGVAYIFLIVAGLRQIEGDLFGSLPAIRAVMANDSALAASWFHYLAFDIFVGSWVAQDSVRRHVHPLLVVPCLALIFLFGPSGLVIYLTLRLATRAHPAADSPS